MVAFLNAESALRTAARRRALLLSLLLALWLAVDPRSFVGLWLTPDQQGRLWFAYGDYTRAANSFEDPRWIAVSRYAAQDFMTAAQYFSQYQDAEALLARGNALAHAREYLDARAAYLELAQRYPDHPAPAINLPIVQALIDANRELSENQQAEAGDMSSEQDNGPRSSEGDERPSLIAREQYTAQEILDDPALRASWLRQVQRNPAEFLASKFYLQLERRDDRLEQNP